MTGLRRLIRFVLRRDRLRLALWTVGLVGLVVSSAAGLPPVYPDQDAIDRYVRLFGDNPALVAFAGPGYGFDRPNIGVILVNEVQLYAALGVALMAVFLVVRHTRAEEDDERAELVRSSVVGRHAHTGAAVLVVAAVQVVLGGIFAAAFVALDYPVAGSLALAGSIAATGLAFTGVGAVAAQLAGTSRAALALGTSALGVAFALRAIGDIADNALVWLSPIGWAQAVRAYADERWWALGLCLVFAVAMVALAFWLSTRREAGSGILPTRLGPDRASAGLRRPLGLAFRLQRGALVGWTIGLFVTGVLYGSIAGDIEEMIRDNPIYEDVLAQAGGASIIDSFFSTAALMLGLLAGGFAISSALRARTEESTGRAEPLLAGPVGRVGWVGSHVVIAVLGTIVVLAAGGLGVGLTHAAGTGGGRDVGRLVVATLVTAPAVLVLVGRAVALFGLLPRWSLAAWGGLAGVVVVGMFGELLRLPAWAREVSPFTHLPAAPAEAVRVAPLAALVVIALLLAAAGSWGLRRRDLRTV